MTKVALIVSDAGPLISLARANALELLLALDIPVYVVDHVLYEVGRPEFADGKAILDFVASQNEQVHIYETVTGQQAKAHREAGHTGRQPSLGEAAISEFLSNYDLGFDDLSPILIFEENDIKKKKFILPDSVHVISTMSFLKGLELDGLIESAEKGATHHKPNGIDREAQKAAVGGKTSPHSLANSFFPARPYGP